MEQLLGFYGPRKEFSLAEALTKIFTIPNSRVHNDLHILEFTFPLPPFFDEMDIMSFYICEAVGYRRMNEGVGGFSKINPSDDTRLRSKKKSEAVGVRSNKTD